MEAWPFLSRVSLAYPTSLQKLVGTIACKSFSGHLSCVGKNNKHTASIASTNIPINKQSSRPGS
jgi:hypothetical protein